MFDDTGGYRFLTCSILTNMDQTRLLPIYRWLSHAIHHFYSGFSMAMFVRWYRFVCQVLWTMETASWTVSINSTRDTEKQRCVGRWMAWLAFESMGVAQNSAVFGGFCLIFSMIHHPDHPDIEGALAHDYGSLSYPLVSVILTMAFLPVHPVFSQHWGCEPL